MMKILKAIAHFFEAEKTEYWHRDRSIEIVAKEKGIDIDVLKEETKAMLEKEGRYLLDIDGSEVDDNLYTYSSTGGNAGKVIFTAGRTAG